MGGLGDFFLKACEWLYGFWPVAIIDQWERGIRLTRGHVGADVLQPGIRWFWPAIGEIHTVGTNIESFETGIQTVGLLTFSLRVQARVVDPRQMYLKLGGEWQDEVVTVARAAACSDDDVDIEQVLRRTRKRMHGWGVEVQVVEYVDYVAEASVLRLLNGAE